MLIDAGPLIALIDRDDADHAACKAALAQAATPFTTTLPVFTEAMYLIGERVARPVAWRAQSSLWEFTARGAVQIGPIDDAILRRCRELMAKHRDLPMDLADASLVALAEALDIDCIFTLDRHFRVYRLHGRRRFTIIP